MNLVSPADAPASASHLPRVLEYRVFLDLDGRTGEFRGRVEIDLDQIAGAFSLNSSGLTLGDARLNDAPVDLEEVSSSEELRLSDPRCERATLEIPFRGKASDRGLLGLYRCRYGTETILTTQCQPTGARRLFPCIDRPDRKAPFRLELTVDRDLDVIFNTPQVAESPDGLRVRRTFSPTPPMSTYLFYLGVGRFDWLRDEGSPVRLGVAAPIGRGDSGRFALAKARLLLGAYEEYFGIPYPLPKLDLVTVPEHPWGAMENWGAISFRDMRLLVDARSTGRQRRDTVSTIAHEIAHQWFGNLVTMEWWTDIWLNESFATLMELNMVDRLDPASEELEEFLILWNGTARLGDSLSSTHPVVTPVERPDEIGQAFDEISYGKGASVLRMVEGVLGDEAFRSGVHGYLEAHRFGNARSQDLWDALEHASGRPVGAMMRAWVERPGLPLVRAVSSDDGVELRQERFSLMGRHAAGTWPIPLGVRSASGTETVWWESDRRRLPSAPWLHLNPDARGFYRVLYDPTLCRALESRLASFSPLDRWTLLDDLFAFLLSGDVPAEQFLRFLDAAGANTDYLTVQELAGDAAALFQLSGGRGSLADAGRRYLRSQWRRLGPNPRPGETESSGILREAVANALVFVDDAVARELAPLFDSLDRVAVDVRGPVAASFARIGGSEAIRRIRSLLEKETAEGMALRLEYALVSSRDPAQVATVLGWIGTPVLNRAHSAQIVRRAAGNPQARTVTWEWIRGELPAFAERFPGTDFASYVLQHALPWVGIGRVAEVREFLKTHPVPSASRGAAKGLAMLEVNDRFAQRVGG